MQSKKPLRLGRLLTLSVSLFAGSFTARGASMTLEQKYQDVFVSAGYATALGAAIGAAMLSFKEEPTDHLRYIAVGASVGFFAGTAFGTYMVVAPAFSLNDNGLRPSENYAFHDGQERQIIIRPTLNANNWSFKGIEAGMVLAKF